jgi:hypothetical protein
MAFCTRRAPRREQASTGHAAELVAAHRQDAALDTSTPVRVEIKPSVASRNPQ